MPYELQCFNPELYASLDACYKIPDQCIAPTARKIRCPWSLNSKDVERASNLERQARSCPEGEERHDLIKQIVLLHCCVKCHRHKLESDDTGCLEKLIKIFCAGIGMYDSLSTSEQQYPQLLQLPAAVSILNQRVLRNRTICTASTYNRSVKQPYFRPYKSGPEDTIRGNLLEAIPPRKSLYGYLYSFTWPSHPEYVKIGYTSGLVENRINRWRSCHNGARLASSAGVAYPEKMERLIHLQLAQHRYRIDLCAICRRSHEEWFKQSASEVKRVIDDWTQLAARESLYGPEGRLTARWESRIKNLTTDHITARDLHNILDAEAQAELAMKAAELAVAKLAETQTFEEPPTSQSAAKTDDQPDDKSQDQTLAFFADFMLSILQVEELLVSNLALHQETPALPDVPLDVLVEPSAIVSAV